MPICLKSIDFKRFAAVQEELALGSLSSIGSLDTTNTERRLRMIVRTNLKAGPTPPDNGDDNGDKTGGGSG